MNITSNDAIKKLHVKLNDGINTLLMTKGHLESFQKDLEASVMVQLKNAKAALKEKKKGGEDAMAKMKQLAAAGKKEAVTTVAEWKAMHNRQKLEARAERAEAYADTCVTLALYYAAKAELALLEAIAARQDASKR